MDIDKEILYWIEQLGYEWIDCGRLIDYIKENYVKTQQEVVEEYVELMEIKVPSLDILNWVTICKNDDDYEKLCENKYLNIYALESDEIELKRLNLII